MNELSRTDTRRGDVEAEAKAELGRGKPGCDVLVRVKGVIRESDLRMGGEGESGSTHFATRFVV